MKILVSSPLVESLLFFFGKLLDTNYLRNFVNSDANTHNELTKESNVFHKLSSKINITTLKKT